MKYLLSIILLFSINCLCSKNINLSIKLENFKPTKSILIDASNPLKVDTVLVITNSDLIDTKFEIKTPNLLELKFYYDENYTSFQSVYFELDSSNNNFSLMKDEKTKALQIDKVSPSNYVSSIKEFYKESLNSMIKFGQNPDKLKENMYNITLDFIKNHPDKSFGYFALFNGFELFKNFNNSNKELLAKYNSVNDDNLHYRRLVEKVNEFNIQSSKEIPNYYLNNISGEKILINEKFEIKKKVIFWASWCSPCLRELNALVANNPNYDDYILISIDANKQKWLDAIKKHKLDKFENYIDQADYKDSFRSYFSVISVPFHLIIKNNKIFAE